MPDPIDLTPVTDKRKPIDLSKSTLPADYSVMNPPQTLGQKIETAGKSTLEKAVGAGGIMGGAEMGAELGAISPIPGGAALGALGGAAVGGLAAPALEYGAAKAVGDNPTSPTVHDAVKSAAWNTAFQGAGDIMGALGGTAAEAKPEMEQLPKGAQTTANLKQALRNRDFFKQSGMSDEEIDAAVKTPGLQNLYEATKRAAENTKGAFKTVYDTAKADFNQRYDAAFGSQKDAPVDAVTIGKAMETAADQGERELSPGFTKFLQSKGRELQQSVKTAPDQMSDWEAVASVEGTKEANRLAKGSPDMLKAHAGMARKVLIQDPSIGAATVKPVTVGDMRDIRTELNENLPSNATPLEKKVYQQIRDQMTAEYESAMTKAGAKPGQLAAVRAVDADYGPFIDTIKALDPRSERFGKQVADALFDPMVTKGGAEYGLNFIRLARAAEAANPGEVMPQLRAAFLQKAAEESMTGNTPMNAMKVLQKLQNQWGSFKASKVVLKEMFGDDSPLTDPVKFSQVLAAPVEKEQTNRLATYLSRAASAPYLLRTMALIGIAGGSMYSISGHPERIVPIIGTMLGLAVAAPLLGRLDAVGQRAFVDFKINPTPESFKRFMDVSGAMLGAEVANPKGTAVPPAAPAAPPLPPTPLPKLAMNWKAAPEKDKPAIKAEMSRRLKAEYSGLSPADKKAINPVLADIYRPKPERPMGAGT